jgi:hypothetical protein
VDQWLRWILLAAAGFAVLSYLAHRSIYYPSKFPTGWWEEQKRLGAADVELTAADGVKLHGWWLRRADSQIATLFLHGNAGNVTHRSLAMAAVSAAGSSILVVDYRGFGKSEGRPSEAGLYADAAAAYDFLIAQGFAANRIVLHGESLGCAVAIELAAGRPCAGLVLEAPFTSARDVAARVFPVLGPMLVWGYDSQSKIGRVKAPLLIIHGGRDEIIDVWMGRRLHEMGNEPKQLWIVPGAGHNNLISAAGPAYGDRLAAFYAQIQ